ncbi:hypothetical protein [Klebsiella aerogenes]|uniref:hypothetical protein n=1 Tax=Klebsiella aerogenes TaxID=548 RepID=UPI0035131EFD|nr:hypothetical protein [Klebsiella aerogenes]
MFGHSGSATTSTTSNTSSWLSGLLEPIVTDFINDNPTFDYTDSTVAGLTPAEQAALAAYGSGASAATGKAIAGAGAGLVSDSVNAIQGLLGGGAIDQMTKGVSGLYNAAGGFMDDQMNAIQDSVYSEMGAQFGQSAQSNMASTAVSGSSAAQNATNSVIASGANSMVQQEAALQQKVLGASVGLTGKAMGAEVGLINELLGAGGAIAKAGAGMAAHGTANQFKAGLFEQYFNQQNANNDRKNSMINDNMDWFNMSLLLNTVLPTAGLDTTTTGSSATSTSSHGGGRGGSAAILAAMV